MVEELTERIRIDLVDALVRLRVTHLLVIELSSVNGGAEPRVAVSATEWGAGMKLELATFEWLFEHSGASPLQLGSMLLGREDLGAWASPLEVRPSFGPIDTLLLAFGDPAIVDAAALGTFADDLAPGLSRRRAAVLGSVMLSAVESASDPIQISDRFARLFYVNSAWERAFGHSRSEVLGKTSGSVLRDPRPLHDPAFYDFTEKQLDRGESWLGVLSSRTREGGTRLFEVNVNPFAATEPEFLGNVVVRRDLGHRSKRDAALVEAHSQFRSVLAAMPDGVAVLRDGLIYYANAPFLRLLGAETTATPVAAASGAGVIGRPMADFIHPDDRGRFASHDGKVPFEVRVLTLTGSHRCAEVSTGGTISFEAAPGTILVVRDTTERRAVENQLLKAERLSALGGLAASVAHELNNPLAFVIMNLELAQAAARSGRFDEVTEALAEALDGTRRVLGITSELRTFSAPPPDDALEIASVGAAVTSAVNLARHEIRHRARLERSVEDSLYVRGREGQLVQVLVSLLVNAALAIPMHAFPAHELRITASASASDRVHVAVTHIGSALLQEHARRLFEALATSPAAEDGVGVGLAICRRIVERMGGTISVTSPPEGATIAVDLPRAQAPGAQRSEDGLAAGDRPARLRVLIVDDEPAIRRALQRVLAVHEVTTAADGQEAIALLAQREFDVILCDLTMPGVSGFVVYDAAKAVKLGDRFAFMSGGAVNPSSSDEYTEPDVPFLPKPFANAEVLAFVERLHTTRLRQSSPSGSGD